MRYDYLEVPTGGIPIIIEGRRYLGNRHLQEIDLEQSTNCLLSRIVKDFDPHEAKYLKANTLVKDINRTYILWLEEEVKSDEWAYDLSPHSVNFSPHAINPVESGEGKMP